MKIAHDVRLGQFSEAVVTLWTHCQEPFVVQELVVELVQAGGDSGSRSGDFGIVCDGAWHRLTISVNTPDGGSFGPRLTTVTARLTVSDPVTGDPVQQARDRITDFVHAQVEVKVSRDVRLGQGDALLVKVYVRCERPWVPQPLTVFTSQDDGSTVGSTSGEFGIVCDDRWHGIDLQVFPSGERFHRGRTTVEASLEVLDPIDFDPVEQATDSVTVWVNAAADVKIARHARVEADGTLLLPVWARCQRPWVVADLSVDVGQEETGAGGSASGEFGLVCDGRWHRVEVAIEPSPGPFVGEFVAHAFFTVLDPISFDPVDQAQDTATFDTPFVIDFSTPPEGVFDPNFYESDGIVFPPQRCGSAGCTPWFIGFVQGDEALIQDPAFGPVTATFTHPIFGLSLEIAPGIQGTATYTLTAFSGSGDVLATMSRTITQDSGDPEDGPPGYFAMTLELPETPAASFTLDSEFVRSSFGNNTIEYGVSSITLAR